MLWLKAESLKWICLTGAMTLITAGYYLLRNNFWGARYLTAQRVKFAAGSYLELKTRNYDIKYTEYDYENIVEIANTAEVAYDLVGNFFGRKLERRIPLIVYKDSVSLASGFKWGRDQKAAGVYWRGTIGILSPRLYVKNTKQVQRNFLKQGPVVHELVHLWVDDMTQGNYTRWWSEGVAQYVERELTGFAFGNPFVREREFDYYTLEELENGFDDLDKSIAYWESLKFIDFIVKEHGPGCVVEIVNALRRNEKMSQVVEGVTSIRYDMLQKLFYQELDINEREV